MIICNVVLCMHACIKMLVCDKILLIHSFRFIILQPQMIFVLAHTYARIVIIYWNSLKFYQLYYCTERKCKQRAHKIAIRMHT
jgi:hypothetical protein